MRKTSAVLPLLFTVLASAQDPTPNMEVLMTKIPTDHHEISAKEAKQMVSRVANNSDAFASALGKLRQDGLSRTFEASAFLRLLAQPGANKIRLYFGIDADNSLAIVGVAVDIKGDELPACIDRGTKTPGTVGVSLLQSNTD